MTRDEWENIFMRLVGDKLWDEQLSDNDRLARIDQSIEDSLTEIEDQVTRIRVLTQFKQNGVPAPEIWVICYKCGADYKKGQRCPQGCPTWEERDEGSL
jgi:hypothetical protein